MAGAHSSTTRAHRSNRRNGAHRVAPKPSRQPYNWLGVGAVTLGLGAAMASGTGVANAKGGTGSTNNSGPSNSSRSDSHSHSPGHGSTANKGHQRQRKPKSADESGSPATSTDSGSPATSPGSANPATATGPSESNSSAENAAADTTGNSGSHRHAKKDKKSTTDDSDQTSTHAKSRTKTSDQTGSSDPTAAAQTPGAVPAAAAPAAPSPAPAPNTLKTTNAKLVPLAATALAASDDTTTTPAPTPHSTDSNPIVAFIQNALISFFTAPSTIQQLAANGLAGPTAPSAVLNPVGAFLYGIFRGMEDFAGLVPHVGTPTTTSDPVTGTTTGTLGFTEPAGAEMTYSVATNPLFGSVSVNTDGTYTYKSNIFGAALAALGLNPTDKFTVTASTGVASTNATVTVAVTSANDTPSTPTSVNQHVDAVTGAVTGTLSSIAPDAEAVTYSVFTQPVQGSVTIDANGNFTYTPTALARVAAIATSITGLNIDAFTVLATSANGSTSLPGIITVPIEPATGATPSTPTAANVTANAVTGVVTGTITSTDPGGAALTYSVFTGTVLGTVSVNSTTGAFTYTPSAIARAAANPILGVSVVNTDAFTVTVSNGSYSSTGLITVPIEPANGDTPSTPTYSNVTTNSSTGVVTGTLSSTSPDGATVSYTVYGLPTQGSVTVSGSTFTYTPSALAQLEASLGLTTDTFAVNATNAAGYTSGLATVTVTVVPIASIIDVPSSPVSSGQNANSISGLVTGTLTANDPAGAPLTYKVVTGPVFGTLTLNQATGEYTYTPYTSARTAANPILGISVVNTDAFSVVATNGTFSSILPSIITVPIAPAVNDTPSDPTATKSQNLVTGVVTGTLSSTSPDGSTIAYSVSPNLLGNDTTTDSNVTLTTINGVTTYAYTPTPSARTNAQPILGGGLGITSDSFTITATNAAGLSNSSTITVPISPASNDTPSGSVVSHTSSNHTTTGTITGSSPDGSALTYSASIKLLSLGSVTIDPKTGAYTIHSAQVLVYVGGTVTFTVTNSSGFSYDFDYTFPA